MSLYALYARPDVFGQAAALSPSIWWADRWIIDYVGSEPKPDARRVVEIPSGQHNEASWRRRFPDVLKRLFAPPEER